MMRANTSSSMQKTYDECFLTCSTAVYFESQNNEAEALRSWKGALDQIYYHNAHRVPTNHRPKSETEKALQDSLHQLELQCKERVDLLEALKRSREEAGESVTSPSPSADANPPPGLPLQAPTHTASDTAGLGWLGGGTVPPVDYTDLYRPSLPLRPALQAQKRSGAESSQANCTSLPPNSSSLSPGLATSIRESRTPSPEKKSRMLRTLRPGGKEGRASSKMPSSMRSRPPAAAKAATQAWGTSAMTNPTRPVYLGNQSSRESIAASQSASNRPSFDQPGSGLDFDRPCPQPPNQELYHPQYSSTSIHQVSRKGLTPPPPRRNSSDTSQTKGIKNASPQVITYRNECPAILPDPPQLASSTAAQPQNEVEFDKTRRESSSSRPQWLPSNPYSSVNNNRVRKSKKSAHPETIPLNENGGIEEKELPLSRRNVKGEGTADPLLTPTSKAAESNCPESDSSEWRERVRRILKNLPKGVDESAAQQILNEIVIHGDEVHWDDVAGLEIAKSALKETVVYPFLRPDLFMGLREPARGMLLFGPPGTGKTMLARAVATESRSTFFAISASSLTSKFLGESEKLVRALFALAKMLAPSIIFVDEIDSLLSSRSGSGEHEATRRIKTEFLIQWSDLARAAAGREQSDKDKERGDASRVLVLAATNLPWAIDEAARRRFVRRQYIPLPEEHIRKSQLKTLLSHQKHELTDEDMDRLVILTEGFSGSDITALAKDAAMGPLRSLGERLLRMTMDEIRPIQVGDFQASLQTIRPSVSKQGLREFEDWAKEFGERGG
ncbi:AAA-domain-containing protein [Lindgomyces ingoldianus]|uniref:AAA-domain-containing protein n=1 Tax=Lindgomyces ingoldianus TaxID=673940 RepID=A0ACB6QJR6_9PLEO|nr:AAA-domain-containing protein [Lindgomyces ingoldianus]KAF2466823.1 AAA-domain-containing protein [Lindgomyces ingoldianus]